MITRLLWTEDDISKLKNEYLKGQRIKIIARRLNRTESAVNKALTRFSIRPDKSFRPKKERGDSVRKIKARERDRQCKLELWVPMDHVVHWLDNQGIFVLPVGGGFMLKQGGEKLSASAVLLLANKLRLQQGRVKFYVENVTW